jgi:uncharacterized protein involved in exopolysaccharide biosynthesis
MRAVTSVEAPNFRARIFFAAFALACLASLAYVFSRPAVYVSSARLQLEAPAGQGQIEERERTLNLLTAAQALIGNAVLDKVVQQLGDSKINPETLRGLLTAAPISGTNVIELRGEGPDRQLLQRILSAWLDAWRQSQTDARDQSSALALEETRSSVTQLGQDVAAKRRDLEQFRKKFDIVSIERDENQAAARLKGINTAINEARSREVNAESRLKAMTENIAAGRTATGSADRTIVVELEKRASDLRDRMKDLEQEYTSQYLALDPKYKAMRANLTRLEQQIEQEKRTSAGQALHGAEEELASARQTVLRLQEELSARKREAQDFTARFSEHTALASQLLLLEGTYDAEKQRLAALEKEKKGTGPRLTVLSPPSLPDRPASPDYWRDALIAVIGSGLLALSAVWFVEFFQRSGVPRPEPVAQPIIHISYPPPGAILDSSLPVLGGSAQRLPETIAQFPRELSSPEVYALWAAALPEARLVIAGLLNGFSVEELAALRYRHIEPDVGCVRVPGASNRSVTLRDPLRRLLIERRPADGGDMPLTNPQGGPLSSADLEGLITCAACDAGLEEASEVTSDTLRHTYFAYLIRQGARLAEVGEFIGRVPPAAFREYGRLSPPGPGLPLEQIDPVFPALRSTAV